MGAGDVARPLGQTAFCRGLTIDALDITDPFAVKDTVAEWCRVRSDSPDHRIVVVNAAAYTAVDAAVQDEATAYAVNATAPALLAQACAANGAKLVHVSTDYVFPGDRVGGPPYEVDDEPGPQGAYGRTKLAGELAVRELLPADSWVVRTAWVYGRVGHNFVKTMARLEATRETITVVGDQHGSPTWSRDLARALWALVRSDAPPGTYHCTGGGATTWHGFAQAVFEELGADPARVQAITRAEYPTPAARPAYSVLSAAAWEGAGLPAMPPGETRWPWSSASGSSGRSSVRHRDVCSRGGSSRGKTGPRVSDRPSTRGLDVAVAKAATTSFGRYSVLTAARAVSRLA